MGNKKNLLCRWGLLLMKMSAALKRISSAMVWEMWPKTQGLCLTLREGSAGKGLMVSPWKFPLHATSAASCSNFAWGLSVPMHSLLQSMTRQRWWRWCDKRRKWMAELMIVANQLERAGNQDGVGKLLLTHLSENWKPHLFEAYECMQTHSADLQNSERSSVTPAVWSSSMLEIPVYYRMFILANFFSINPSNFLLDRMESRPPWVSLLCLQSRWWGKMLGCDCR